MRRMFCLSLLPLVTACGVISHNMAENMTESNRLDMLRGLNDDQLCRGYNNQLVGPNTERQLLEVLRARGISKCEALGRTRVISLETTDVAAAPALRAGVQAAQKVDDPAAVERERQRVLRDAALEQEKQMALDEAKSKEEARVRAEEQARRVAKERESVRPTGEAAALQEIFGPLSPAEIEKVKTVRPATNSEKLRVSEAVKQSLIDPESARFGDVFVLPNKHACIATNAKNQLGGYVGFRMAIASILQGAWQPLGIYNVTLEKCISMIAKLS
jgi:hypothetical protein